MNLYTRDYSKKPTEEEIKKYERIRALETEAMSIGRRNMYHHYPEAVRHYNSLFPNNHIDLFDWKNAGAMSSLTEEFAQLVHNKKTTERDILRYINHKPAQYIIGALLTYKNFGHHVTYIFPEFSIGNGTYFADYLIVGKNSGGYEFVFVELEAPNKSTTIKGGYEGQATRAGLNQIFDWKRMIESDFLLIAEEFKKHARNKDELPIEFLKYDSTRMHYMVVCGVREDYSDLTYADRREKAKNQGIEMYHYDNLIDLARGLEEKSTF